MLLPMPLAGLLLLLPMAALRRWFWTEELKTELNAAAADSDAAVAAAAAAAADGE